MRTVKILQALANGTMPDFMPVTPIEKVLYKLCEKVAGGSGVSSWNDLTDKPFYENSEQIVRVELGKGTAQSDPGGTYYVTEYADATVAVMEKLVDGGKYRIVLNGEYTGELLWKDDGRSAGGNATSDDFALYIGGGGGQFFASTQSQFTLSAEKNVIEIYLDEVKTIDDKFIPGTIARAGEVMYVRLSSTATAPGEYKMSVDKSFADIYNAVVDRKQIILIESDGTVDSTYYNFSGYDSKSDEIQFTNLRYTSTGFVVTAIDINNDGTIEKTGRTVTAAT